MYRCILNQILIGIPDLMMEDYIIMEGVYLKSLLRHRQSMQAIREVFSQNIHDRPCPKVPFQFSYNYYLKSPHSSQHNSSKLEHKTYCKTEFSPPKRRQRKSSTFARSKNRISHKRSVNSCYDLRDSIIKKLKDSQKANKLI